MKKRICAECKYWEVGEFWSTGSGKHGVLVESKGWCMFKKKRKRWNYCGACKDFDKKPKSAFIYQGGGGNSIERDLTNIAELMKELAEDNINQNKNIKESEKMIKEFKTRTGAIYCDTVKKLEYLYVGDYGKENNIKADFLGFEKEINQVQHHNVDLADKMVVTISTQKGCPMNCMFCDCPKVDFGGNASREELAEEVSNAIGFSGCTYTRRFNLHLARMGEPALNAKNVLEFLRYDLRDMVNDKMVADTIHPVFTTMMPKSLGIKGMGKILDEFCRIKNYNYDGEAGLQLSINSTNAKQRDELFRGRSMSLEAISHVCRMLPMPKGRKYTLNFPVTDKTILDPKELSRLFDKDKFIVKITPIHETNEATVNGINTPEGYYKYDVYRQFEQPLLAEGWQVIVFIPSKEEDEDRITCGNALLSMNIRSNEL
jgi:23S rRNA (adenine2503-C2)-methyltransferase